jgi:hypothetical protein
MVVGSNPTGPTNFQASRSIVFLYRKSSTWGLAIPFILKAIFNTIPVGRSFQIGAAAGALEECEADLVPAFGANLLPEELDRDPLLPFPFLNRSRRLLMFLCQADRTPAWSYWSLGT